MKFNKDEIWDSIKLDRIERPEDMKAFLHDIEAVYHKHGLSIAHEDGHGGFLVEKISDYNIRWLWDASKNYLTNDEASESETVSVEDGTPKSTADAEKIITVGVDPVALKSDYLLLQCNVAMRRLNGCELTPIQKSIVDRCVRELYQPIFAAGNQYKPTLRDFCTALAQQPEPEIREVVTALDAYIQSGEH